MWSCDNGKCGGGKRRVLGTGDHPKGCAPSQADSSPRETACAVLTVASYSGRRHALTNHVRNQQIGLQGGPAAARRGVKANGTYLAIRQVAMFANLLTSQATRHLQPRIRFGPSLAGTWFKASGPLPNGDLRDEFE